MAKYTLEQITNLDNRNAIIDDITSTLQNDEFLQGHHLEELFDFRERESYFVIKALVVNWLYGADQEISKKLLSNLENYSWCSFDHSILASEKKSIAERVYNLVYEMAVTIQRHS